MLPGFCFIFSVTLQTGNAKEPKHLSLGSCGQALINPFFFASPCSYFLLKYQVLGSVRISQLGPGTV